MKRHRIGLGKYVTNLGVIGAAVGAVATARRTASMPHDWRRLIVWGVWAAGFVLAIASVAMPDDDEEIEEI